MADNRVKAVISAGIIGYLLAAAPRLSGADQPKFEVASVKRTDRCGGGGSISPGSVALRGVLLKAVLMEAFQVKMEQIEGPSWLETDCFDIAAKGPEGATRDQVPAMLEALLRERFKLAGHKVERLRSGYALVVDKGGPKFKEDDPFVNFMGRQKGMMLFSAAGAPFGAVKGAMSMATLAATLSTKGYGPVQDLTGLTGKYDIELRWRPNPGFEPNGPGATIPMPEGWPETDLLTAVRESLGLKMERRDVQVQFLVIDHIERAPAEN